MDHNPWVFTVPQRLRVFFENLAHPGTISASRPLSDAWGPESEAGMWGPRDVSDLPEPDSEN